jgi:ABC-type microcin C transport system permease subunit YejB/ABC-type oligopeptide transport system substrate-binding subunit
VACANATAARVEGGAAGASAGVSAPAAGVWSHAFAVYGEPKYPAGFAHYDYVNPDAPKRGTLNLGNPDRRSSFTRLNPYLLKGSGAFGSNFFCFETLFDPSQDEAGVMYGLVAEAIQVAPDLSSVSVRINPRAHFNNGDPVTAADLKYAFDAVTGNKASPAFAAQLAMVKRAVIVDALTVRFELAVQSREAIYALGTTLPVFSPKWGAGPDGKTKPFDKIIDDVPVATGAYVVAKTYSGRRLDLVRDPNYWARTEGVRRGFYNFDKIVYRYYADQAVQFEAFKAGDIDLHWETNLKRWGRQYKGSKFGPGQIVAKVLPMGQGAYVRSLLLNLRRPVFQDIRVREALQLSFDFEWMNAQSFNLFARIDSAFSNSDFAATGLPLPGELAILEPYRAQLPAAVFGPPYQNPRTDTGPTALRDGLKRARDLLAQAGWRPRRRQAAAQRSGSGVQHRVAQQRRRHCRFARALAGQPGQARRSSHAAAGRLCALRQTSRNLRFRYHAAQFRRVPASVGDVAENDLRQRPGGQGRLEQLRRHPRPGARCSDAGDGRSCLDAETAGRGARLRPRADAAALCHSLVAATGLPHGVVGQLRHTGTRAALLHRHLGQQQRQSLADRQLVERAGHPSWPGQAMTRYIATRLLLMLPTLLGVLTATFILIQFVPGGPVEQAISELRQQRQESGHGGELDAVQVAAIKKLYGFDKPPLERFWLTVSSFARFDFGTSFQNNKDVWTLIRSKLPVSISLGVWSFLAAYLLSIPLGVAKAVREGSRFDALSSLAVLAGFALPGFVLGVVLIVLFCGGTFLEWFPLRGLTSDNWLELSWPARIADYFWHLALPLVCLTIGSFATLTMLTKNTFIERSTNSTCWSRRKACRAKVLYKHVFRNAMLPIVPACRRRWWLLLRRCAADRDAVLARRAGPAVV